MSKNQLKKGFTLIELLVVIAIIGLLSSVVLASLNQARMKARDTRRIQDLKQIQNALELYKLDHNGKYPSSTDLSLYGNWCFSTDSCWPALLNRINLGSTKINSLPIDPINNSNSPWNPNNYSYAYMSGYSGPSSPNCSDASCYDLIAQFEDVGNPYRCGIKGYIYLAENRSWCNNLYSPQIYSPQN